MTQETSSKTKSFLMGCGIAALVPIVLLILTAVIFTVNNRPIKISIPSHTVPKDNGLDWFVRAADAGKRLSPTSDTNGPNWTMADYKLFMKDNAACFAIQRQALTKPCVNSPSRGITGMAMFKVGAKIRELARTLQGEAMYYEKIGDFGKAVDSQLDCVEMGVSMPNKGALLTDLVAIGVESIGMHDIKRKLPKLNPDELAHAAARIEQIRKKRVPYSEIVMEGGYMTASYWIEIFNNRKTRQELLDPRTWSQWSFSSGPPRYFDGLKFAFANKTGIVNQILRFS
ncbi:MAG: hypothetical protein NT018_08275, partial [Armatimonadetes bacterium]|nr:hypothetical protein [Armatimonadota bacterium]